MTGISDIEVKAVLALRERCGPDPIVFDVGSNKGDWASILAANVKEIHLFEPNEILLHYSMVRFDRLTNIKYNNSGVSDETGVKEFFYFVNYNNGLSSLFYDDLWNAEKLPYKRTMINVMTIDLYYDLNYINEIDILKIDVEGADYNVLLGAKNLLKDQKIRFIQIEKSEHLKRAGHSFQDIIDLVTENGYLVRHFDGNDFVPYAEQEAENFYIMREYTQDWNSEFKKNTKGLKVETALEIGCFEGLTTNYICDNILKEGGRVICIDPLTDEYLPGHKDNEMFKGQYERFIRNTKGRPVELIRKKSVDAYPQLKDLRFGFIYVDGDHTESGVYSDAVLYWNLLLDSPKRQGGYMLFDDYGQSEETKLGIDRFLETQKGNFDLLIKDYQVLIRRLW